MEGREKVYFTIEETTIYPKSLGIYLKSFYYLDEVWFQVDYLSHFCMKRMRTTGLLVTL